MRRLVASHCSLEPQLASHANEMFDVLGDPAIYEFENAPPVSLAWLRERFQRLERRGPGGGAERWLNWVVRLPSGELAGYVQATLLDDGASFIAYELASRHWRQGIGSSAVRAVLTELRESYGVDLFVAVLKPANHRSRGLLTKLGFRAASEAQAAVYRDDADERVMVQPASELACRG